MKTPYDSVEAPGKKPMFFKKGGLHRSIGVPDSQKIPAAKRIAALKGKFGEKAKKQANFAKNVLVGRGK